MRNRRTFCLRMLPETTQLSPNVYYITYIRPPCNTEVPIVVQSPYLILLELGQCRIFVCTNIRNWPKNLQWTRTKLLSAVWGVTSTGIFPSLACRFAYICLTTGRHLGFTEKLRSLRSKRLFANSWDNAATAFSLSSQFYVCGCEWYKLYSRKRCILAEGKRLGGEIVSLQYPV